MAKSGPRPLTKKFSVLLDRITPAWLRECWAQTVLWLLDPRQKLLSSHYVGRHLLKDRKFLEFLKCRLDSLEIEKELFGDAEACSQKEKLLSLAAAHALRSGAEGLWLEFGVWRGSSINLIARLAHGRTVHGFDSFEGLPEKWVIGKSHANKPGKRDEKGKLPRVEPNVRLIKGWFDKTLPAFLKEHPEPAVFVHIDGDLYSSAKCVLDRLRFADEAVIMFDEYFNYPAWREGEYKAFQEFLAAQPDAAATCLGFCPTGQTAFILRHKESPAFTAAHA